MESPLVYFYREVLAVFEFAAALLGYNPIIALVLLIILCVVPLVLYFASGRNVTKLVSLGFILLGAYISFYSYFMTIDLRISWHYLIFSLAAILVLLLLKSQKILPLQKMILGFSYMAIAMFVIDKTYHLV